MQPSHRMRFRNEDGETADTATLRGPLRAAEEAQAALQAGVNNLRQQLTQERDKYKQLWGLNCLQMAEFQQVLSGKEEELKGLRQKLPQGLTHGGGSRPGSVALSRDEPGPPNSEGKSSSLAARRGRAPPVEMFSGEDSETTLEDWLPSLERAAEWNKCGKLIQLAGHFTGRAGQKWNLMSEEDKSSARIVKLEESILCSYSLTDLKNYSCKNASNSAYKTIYTDCHSSFA